MNPQLDVLVGFGCNARCGFCIQEVTRKVRDDLPVWRSNLRQSVAYVQRQGVSRVVITGGEPTLPAYARRSLEALKVLSQFEWEFLALYTNGTGLLNNLDGSNEPLVRQLRRAGLTDINLSAHHYNQAQDEAIYRLARPPLVEIVDACLAEGLKVRLNLTLQRGGVETLVDLLTYLNWARDLGVKDVYVRDLFQLEASTLYNPAQFDTREVVVYTNDHRVDFNVLLGAIEQCPAFKLQSSRTKNEAQGHELHYRYRGDLPVYLSDLVIGREAPGERTYWVVMPNGQLYDAFTSEAHHVSTGEADG